MPAPKASRKSAAVAPVKTGKAKPKVKGVRKAIGKKVGEVGGKKATTGGKKSNVRQFDFTFD